jgi:hypothetical protein
MGRNILDSVKYLFAKIFAQSGQTFFTFDVTAMNVFTLAIFLHPNSAHRITSSATKTLATVRSK